MARPSGSTSIAMREADEEPLYRRLFARSGFGFAALDGKGRIIDANAAFLAPFGVAAVADLPAFKDCASPKDRSVLAFAMRTGVAEQTPWELRLQRADGGEFWVLASFIAPPTELSGNVAA